MSTAIETLPELPAAEAPADSEMPDGLKARMERFIHLTKEKRDTEATLREIQDELLPLESALVEDFALAGLQRVTKDGVTLYRQAEFQASIPAELREPAHAALIAAGAGAIVKESVNAQSLKAWVRERIEEAGERPAGSKPEDALPEGVRPYIRVFEMHRLRMKEA